MPMHRIGDGRLLIDSAPVSSTGRMVFRWRVPARHTMGRSATNPTATSPIACAAVGSAISGEMRTVLLSAREAVVVTVLSGELTITVVRNFARALCSVVGAHQGVVAVVAVWLLLSRTVGGSVLNATVAANQSVVAVVAAVGLIRRIGARFVFVPAAIGTVISVRMVCAVRSVVRVLARLIASDGMIRAVGAVVRGVF